VRIFPVLRVGTSNYYLDDYLMVFWSRNGSFNNLNFVNGALNNSFLRHSGVGRKIKSSVLVFRVEVILGQSYVLFMNSSEVLFSVQRHIFKLKC
jgi:hypothetical protein